MSCKQCREYKKSLSDLTEKISLSLLLLDEAMKKPESTQKESRIAQIANYLDMANDAALHFGLKISFKSKKWKELHKVVTL